MEETEKDLKRKKTMNIILLPFVVLSAMFASAAVNDIIAVTGGIEHYFDAADVPDVTVMFYGENDAGGMMLIIFIVGNTDNVELLYQELGKNGDENDRFCPFFNHFNL